MPVEELPADLLMYLLPSRFCQSDRLGSVSSWEFANEPKGYERVDAICRWVRQRTRLVAENTAVVRTALDTLTEKEGSYRDFAHLAIALCRSLSIPARFVTGIDYRREESDHGHASTDFHAYIEAYLGDRWYVFDPVGMSPTTALLRIGTGRDAADVAFATAFGNVWCVAPTMWIDRRSGEGLGRADRDRFGGIDERTDRQSPRRRAGRLR